MSSPLITDFGLRVDSGEKLQICGPNGSGKSTLLKIIAGALTPKQGKLTVFGKSMDTNKFYIQSHLALSTFSNNGFFSLLSGKENLDYFIRFHRLDRKKALEQLYPLKDLPNYRMALQSSYIKCSHGMRQILHFARAWMRASKIILLDEPFANLDVQSKEKIIFLLEESDTTTVLTSHESQGISHYRKVWIKNDPHN